MKPLFSESLWKVIKTFTIILLEKLNYKLKLKVVNGKKQHWK